MMSNSTYIKPGDLHVSKSGEILKTTVGSCISVCLYDSQCKMGGMNHYIYAEVQEDMRAELCGDVAISRLIDMMLKNGSRRKDIRAILVGGASSFSSLNPISAGQKNINVAEKILKEKGIPVIKREVGGCHGRRVLYHTDNGSIESSLLDDCMRHCKKGGKSCQFRIISPDESNAT